MYFLIFFFGLIFFIETLLVIVRCMIVYVTNNNSRNLPVTFNFSGTDWMWFIGVYLASPAVWLHNCLRDLLYNIYELFLCPIIHISHVLEEIVSCSLVLITWNYETGQKFQGWTAVRAEIIFCLFFLKVPSTRLVYCHIKSRETDPNPDL